MHDSARRHAARAQVVTFTIYESLSKMLQRTIGGRAAVEGAQGDEALVEARIQRAFSSDSRGAYSAIGEKEQ